MELNKEICVKKKANGLYFYKGHDEVKEGQPNQNKSNWSKESKEICTKSKSNRNRIPTFTSVRIFDITFGLDVQLRLFKLGCKANLKGYNFVKDYQ